jgi:hypothetical protein
LVCRSINESETTEEYIKRRLEKYFEDQERPRHIIIMWLLKDGVEGWDAAKAYLCLLAVLYQYWLIGKLMLDGVEWILWWLFLRAVRHRAWARQSFPTMTAKLWWLPNRLTWWLWRKIFGEGVIPTICEPRGVCCQHNGSRYVLFLQPRPYPAPQHVYVIVDCATPRMVANGRIQGPVSADLLQQCQTKMDEYTRMSESVLNDNPVMSINYLLDWLIETDAILNPPPVFV